MDKDKRGIGFSVGLIAIAFAWTVLADPPSQQSKQWQSKQTAKNQQKISDAVKSFNPNFIDWLSAKFGVTGCGPYSVDRFGQSSQIKNDEYYRACDLEAQESSANSTRWLLLIAALQTVLAIVGTGLVWRSLSYTRLATNAATNATSAAIDAANTAKTAYLAEHRPWLKFAQDPIVTYSVWENGDEGFTSDGITIECNIENFGGSPAIGIETNIETRKFGILDITFNKKFRTDEFLNKFMNGGNAKVGQTIFSKDTVLVKSYERDIPETLPPVRKLEITVCFRYFMEGQERPFATCIGIEIFAKDIQVKLNKIGSHKIPATVISESLTAT